MNAVELSEQEWLQSIWNSLNRGEAISAQTVAQLESLLAQNQAITKALTQLGTAIKKLPAPVVNVDQTSTLSSDLESIFERSQSAQQQILDQIKEAVKSVPNNADKNPTRIMAGSPSSIKLQRKDGAMADWHADGGLQVHLTNPGDIAGGGGGSGGLTDTQLRATPVPVSGAFYQATQPVSGPLTDTQLRATPVPVSTGLILPGSLDADGGLKTHVQNQITQPLTDAQLRASSVPVSTGLILPGALDADGGLKTHIQNTVPVSGTFWQATQPVSGPLTDTQLRASAVPVSGPLTDAQLRASAVPVALQAADLAALETISVANFPATQPVSGTVEITNDVGNPIPVSFAAGAAPTYKGRACGFRTPGRVALTQPIFSFWNGSASKVCRIKFVGVDAASTVVKAATVVPPLVRFYRCTAAPTNGATVTKAPEDSTLTSDANIIIRCDASADGTSAASALAATVSGGALTQEFTPRLITAAGYEAFDKSEFFEQSEVIIRPSEGLVVRLEAPANMVVTDSYIVNMIWTEE